MLYKQFNAPLCAFAFNDFKIGLQTRILSKLNVQNLETNDLL